MTPDQRTALNAELQNDPLGLGYAGLNAVLLHGLLTAPARPGVVPVAAVDVKRVLILAGKWPGIVIASRASHPAAVNITEALATFERFDMADPVYVGAITAGLQALVDAALISADDMAACLALGTGLISRADELGLAGLDVESIRRALADIEGAGA